MYRLSLDQLQTFAQVVDGGSFSAAAQRLELSQPAVSLQVRQLEKRLGVRLVERVGRRAAPTAAGEELLVHVRSIDAAVSSALEAMARHSKGVMGRVRLGTGATACIYFLPPVLRELRNRFPSLSIIVHTGDTPDILKAIEENTIDVGLVTLPAPGRMFDVTPVLEDEFVAMASADSIKLPGKTTPSNLSKLPLVLHQASANTRILVNQWFTHAGLTLRPIMELDSVEAIKELVGAGLGCSIVTRMALPDTGRRRKMTVRSLSPRLYRKLAIVLRRDKPVHRSLREVVSAIKSFAEMFAKRQGR
jgi:DNA-binding transcriptional LysR family regulator